MGRLKKLSRDIEKNILKDKEIDIEVAKKSIDSLEVCIDDIIDKYTELFMKLNKIAEEYPKLEEKLRMLISFPDENETKDIVKMKKDIEKLKEKYNDEKYLADSIGINID